MHLPAQYECMPRGAERENGLLGESHTGHTRTKEDAWDRWRKKKSLKLQYGRCRMWSTREREEEQNKNKEDEWWDRESKKEKAAEEKRGLAGLPVPPVSWDYLLLQSTVAQQKQREQQNYTHLPSQPFPHYLNAVFYIWPITYTTVMAVSWSFFRNQTKKKKKV